MLTPRERSISGNAPLSFRAKGGSIKSLKQYGKCVQDGTPTPDAPVDIICNNGVLKIRHQSGLPIGYQRLKFLKSTGTQLINTGISGNDDDMVIDIVCKYSVWAQYAAVLGNWIEDGYNAVRIITSNNDDDKFIFNYNSRSGVSVIVDAQKNTRLHIVLKKSSVTVNGKTVELNQPKGTTNNNVIALFNRNVDNPANRNIGLEVESYFVSKNNVVIQNLVPCQRYDNVLGMYDTITNTLLTNAGTDNFIAGDPVDDPVIVVADGTAETITITPDGGTATAADLLSIGDYKDVQDVIGGSVVRNVGVKVLDGTENWSIYNRVFVSQTIDSVIKNGAPFVFCSHLPQGTNGVIIGTGKGKLEMFPLNMPDITTTEQWKIWLADQYAAGTPVIIVYPLAEPTTETVTPQNLRTHSGNNTIDVDSNVDPVEIEVKYKN